MAKNILEIKNLTFSFHTYGGVVKSVRDEEYDNLYSQFARKAL